jgi:hypothetical protein
MCDAAALTDWTQMRRPVSLPSRGENGPHAPQSNRPLRPLEREPNMLTPSYDISLIGF